MLKNAKFWEALYHFLISILTCAVFVVVAVECTTPLEEAGKRATLEKIDAALCGVFFVDFVGHMILSERRWRYFFTVGWLDLISCVPIATLAALGQGFAWSKYGRALRIVLRVTRIFRLTRGWQSLRSLARTIDENRAESAVFSSISLMILAVSIGSTTILLVEQESPDPELVTIKTLPDALMWTLSTLATADCGEFVPTTYAGRIVSFVLTCVGLCLAAVFTALFATWIMEGKQEKRERERRAELEDWATKENGIDRVDV